MDILTNYIQNGKKLGFLKLSLYFLIIVLLIVIGIGSWLYYMLSRPVFQTFLNEIPEIEIQDENIVRPENKVWEKKFADGDFLFKIDTTRDTLDTLPENGIILTKKSYSLTLNNQTQEYQLPKEKIIINSSFLTKLIHMAILNTCIISGIMLWLIFWLGQVSTSILSSFVLWFCKKKTDKENITRASFIGWISVMAINIALRFTGQGFALLTCVLISTAIASFCLVWTSKET
ncbi:MAG: hypothetical protein IKS41_06970 [Alphaproteobacteria bacterium]|nr:hypothetical protein [Alphaproteobacteria bacterium]